MIPNWQEKFKISWKDSRMTRRRPRHERGPPSVWRRRTEIRLADMHDEPQLLDMFMEMHSEQPLHPYSLPLVSAMFRLAIMPGPERQGIIGVIGDRHRIVAGIFLVMDRIWYSEDWHLLEFFNYVRPEARKSTYAKDLIAYAKECSDEIGLDLTIGVFSSIRTEAKCRLYDEQLERMGAFFRHVPKKKALASAA